MRTVDEVLLELGALSANGIARLFISRDVDGECHNPMRCPVATYVARETGELVSVGSTLMRLRRAGPPAYFDVPESVNEFIRIFDDSNSRPGWWGDIFIPPPTMR